MFSFFKRIQLDNLHLFCYYLLKISRRNVFWKSVVVSILFHSVYFFLLWLTPDIKIKEDFLQITLQEDSTVLSDTDRKEVKKEIKEITLHKQKKSKMEELKKLQKVIEQSSQSIFTKTEQDRQFDDSLEKVLNKVQKKNKNYQLAKKASTKWDLEKNKESIEEQINEIASANIVTEKIQWKYASKRTITYRPVVEYPSYYRKRGVQGKTRLLIKVDHLGNVINANIISSSGYSKLDVIAKKTIRATRFSPIDTLGKNGYDEAEIDVDFRLID